MRDGSRGLRVSPTSGCANPAAYSRHWVVANTSAPAARSRRTRAASRRAGRGSLAGLPQRVGRPATVMMSLIATGCPASGPAGPGGGSTTGATAATALSGLPEPLESLVGGQQPQAGRGGGTPPPADALDQLHQPPGQIRLGSAERRLHCRGPGGPFARTRPGRQPGELRGPGGLAGRRGWLRQDLAGQFVKERAPDGITEQPGGGPAADCRGQRRGPGRARLPGAGHQAGTRWPPRTRTRPPCTRPSRTRPSRTSPATAATAAAPQPSRT